MSWEKGHACRDFREELGFELSFSNWTLILKLLRCNKRPWERWPDRKQTKVQFWRQNQNNISLVSCIVAKGKCDMPELKSTILPNTALCVVICQQDKYDPNEHEQQQKHLPNSIFLVFRNICLSLRSGNNNNNNNSGRRSLFGKSNWLGSGIGLGLPHRHKRGQWGDRISKFLFSVNLCCCTYIDINHIHCHNRWFDKLRVAGFSRSEEQVFED